MESKVDLKIERTTNPKWGCDHGYRGEFSSHGETKVEFDITPAKVDKIIKRLMEYYSKYGYIGEVIHRSDDAIIYAPDVLSDICDNMIKFKSTEDQE